MGMALAAALIMTLTPTTFGTPAPYDGADLVGENGSADGAGQNEESGEQHDGEEKHAPCRAPAHALLAEPERNGLLPSPATVSFRPTGSERYGADRKTRGSTP